MKHFWFIIVMGVASSRMIPPPCTRYKGSLKYENYLNHVLWPSRSSNVRIVEHLWEIFGDLPSIIKALMLGISFWTMVLILSLKLLRLAESTPSDPTPWMAFSFNLSPICKSSFNSKYWKYTRRGHQFTHLQHPDLLLGLFYAQFQVKLFSSVHTALYNLQFEIIAKHTASHSYIGLVVFTAFCS